LPEWGAEAVWSGSLVDIRGGTSKAWKPSWNEILPQAGIVCWHPNGRGVVGGSTAGDEEKYFGLLVLVLGIAVKVMRVIMVLVGGFSSREGSTGGGQACGYLYIMPIIRMTS
jgi:hypothetical protein